MKRKRITRTPHPATETNTSRKRAAIPPMPADPKALARALFAPDRKRPPPPATPRARD